VSADPRIVRLELECHDLSGQQEFYGRLGFPQVLDSAGSLRLQAGGSDLIFRTAGAGGPRCYHFAFNISPRRIEQASEWLSSRDIDLLKVDGTERFVFEKWDAEAIYFNDSCGNILEFIARDLPLAFHGPFGTCDIIGISEIGIAVPKVIPFVEDCVRISKLAPYRQLPEEGFTAVGDENGLLIVVPEGRLWYPENRVAAKPCPATIWMETARSGQFVHGPYQFHFLAS
jgi:hypothetical protein